MQLFFAKISYHVFSMTSKPSLQEPDLLIIQIMGEKQWPKNETIFCQIAHTIDPSAITLFKNLINEDSELRRLRARHQTSRFRKTKSKWKTVHHEHNNSGLCSRKQSSIAPPPLPPFPTRNTNETNKKLVYRASTKLNLIECEVLIVKSLPMAIWWSHPLCSSISERVAMIVYFRRFCFRCNFWLLTHCFGAATALYLKFVGSIDS